MNAATISSAAAMDLIVRGATVLTATDRDHADIGIVDGAIVRRGGSMESGPHTRTISATGELGLAIGAFASGHTTRQRSNGQQGDAAT